MIMETRINRLARWIALHWFATFTFLYGMYVVLPFLAPVFMHLGWDAAGRVVYFVYSFLCHQLPERSYFLFGPKLNYSLTEIQSVWKNTENPFVLRQFIGAHTMGWKLAWSDRMVSMFASIWVFALLWFPIRRRVTPLPWWGFALLLLPMALDGTTHAISDLAGIGHGFRDTNLWLAALTHNAFAPGFYAGDAWDSFNGLMRLLTGTLFGLAAVWVIFPYIQDTFPSAIQPGEDNSVLPGRRHISPLVILLFAGLILGMAVGTVICMQFSNQTGKFGLSSLSWVQANPGAAAPTGLQPGQQVPDFSLKTLDGKQVSLSGLAGKARLINFWASRGIPCRSEKTALEKAYQSYQRRSEHWNF